jgi:hypothetical protein
MRNRKKQVLMYKVFQLANMGLGYEDICQKLKITDNEDRESVRAFVLKLR